MSELNEIIQFFKSDTARAAYSFLGQYIGNNTLDYLIKNKNPKMNALELIITQLYDALDESLRMFTTCFRGWNYDEKAIKDTFSHQSRRKSVAPNRFRKEARRSPSMCDRRKLIRNINTRRHINLV